MPFNARKVYERIARWPQLATLLSGSILTMPDGRKMIVLTTSSSGQEILLQSHNSGWLRRDEGWAPISRLSDFRVIEIPDDKIESLRSRAEELEAAANVEEARLESARVRAIEEQRVAAAKRIEEQRVTAANRIDEWSTCIERRKIVRLTHVTRLQNLRSILKNGILPVSAFARLSTTPLRNDPQRYDGHLDAVSLSITHPNDPLFYRWRCHDFPSDTWVVFAISPRVMWELPCRVFSSNAAGQSGTGGALNSHTPSASEFEQLFGEPSFAPRKRFGHSSADTTDPQAEVMVFSSIPLHYIDSVMVRTATDRELVKPMMQLIHDRATDLIIEPSMFDMRPFAIALARHTRTSDAASRTVSDFDDNPF